MQFAKQLITHYGFNGAMRFTSNCFEGNTVHVGALVLTDIPFSSLSGGNNYVNPIDPSLQCDLISGVSFTNTGISFDTCYSADASMCMPVTATPTAAPSLSLKPSLTPTLSLSPSVSPTTGAPSSSPSMPPSSLPSSVPTSAPSLAPVTPAPTTSSPSATPTSSAWSYPSGVWSLLVVGSLFFV